MSIKEQLLCRWRDSNRTQRGQVAIIVAMAFIGLLVFVGLAVDGGLLFMHRVRLRDAFDSAALAGAYELPEESEACARVVDYLNYQGYTTGPDFEFQVIFPEGNELDDYPSIPAPSNRVIDSPTSQDCANLSIAGEHYQVWVTGTQQVSTIFMGLVGLSKVGTATPAVAERPELFDIVFVIPNSNDMRHDSCLWEKDGRYLTGSDFYGNTYACTEAQPDTEEVEDGSDNPILQNYSFEDDIDFEAGTGGWTTSFPDMVSRSNDALIGTWSIELKNGPSPYWCSGQISSRECADIVQTFSTAKTDLYIGFWMKPKTMEAGALHGDHLNLTIRYDTNGNGAVDSDREFLDVVQFCDWYHDDWEPCRYCPDQFDSTYHYGGDYRPYTCISHIAPARWSTGWEYTVAEIPAEAWEREGADPIEIRFWNQGDDDGSSESAGSTDIVLLDEIRVYSAPWLEGPKNRHIVGDSSEGAASCHSTNVWPNCDKTYTTPEGEAGNHDSTPGYGGLFTDPETDDIPDVLFPARTLMQQPLYDVLLSIGKDPALAGPDSFLDILGAGHRFGFVLYRQHTYLNTCTSGPMNSHYFQTGEDTYDKFREFLFNDVSSYLPDIASCGNSGGSGANHAGGIAGARKLLNENGREHTNQVIVLLSHSPTNVVCGEHTDTYCYGQTLCSPMDPDRDDCIAAAESWIDSQVQHAVSNGITVFTIGLGQYADMDLMQSIAEPTGGTWHHAGATSELPDIFAQINEDMEQIVRLTR